MFAEGKVGVTTNEHHLTMKQICSLTRLEQLSSKIDSNKRNLFLNGTEQVYEGDFCALFAYKGSELTAMTKISCSVLSNSDCLSVNVGMRAAGCWQIWRTHSRWVAARIFKLKWSLI